MTVPNRKQARRYQDSRDDGNRRVSERPSGDTQQALHEAVLPGYEPFSGAVAIACVRPLHEDPHSTLSVMSKPVVIARDMPDGSWAVWGLTVSSTYKGSGERRKPAAGLGQVGLSPGYIWSGRLAFLPPHDVFGVVWAAPLELLQACAAESPRLPGWADSRDWVRDTHAEHVSAGWHWPKGRP